MNRIDNLFRIKKENILSVYFTAGYPSLNDTVTIITELEKAGIDMVEIGIPFSDPLADGPVIQQSSHKALANGMNLRLLFKQIAGIRQKVKLPLLLMGYLNPVLSFGMDKFLQKAAETGIDGMILPDLPADEYCDNYRDLFQKSAIHNILLITPQTPLERVRKIDELTGGFLYMVSSASTTGTTKNAFELYKDYFANIARMNLKNPRMVGFGISDKNTFQKACSLANGAIVGSAFIRALANGKSLSSDIHRFISNIR